MRALLVLLLMAGEGLWACPAVSGFELKDGSRKIHGLDSVKVDRGATTLKAGDVTYRISPGDNVCVEITGACGPNPSTMCFGGGSASLACPLLTANLKTSPRGFFGHLTDSKGAHKASIHFDTREKMQYSLTIRNKDLKGDAFTIEFTQPEAETAAYNIKKTTGKTVVQNTFEFKGGGEAAHSRMPSEDRPLFYDIAVAKTTALVDGCKIKGGAPAKN